MMSISLREPYLFDLPIGASALGLSLSAYLSQLGRAPRRRLVLARAPVRNQYLRRLRGPRRGSRLLRLSVAGPRRLPGRQRLHVVVLDQAEPPDVTTATARSCPPRASTCNFPPSKAWAASPGPSSTRRAGCLSPDLQPPGRHRQAVLHLPRPLRHRHRVDTRLRAVLRR